MRTRREGFKDDEKSFPRERRGRDGCSPEVGTHIRAVDSRGCLLAASACLKELYLSRSDQAHGSRYVYADNSRYPTFSTNQHLDPELPYLCIHVWEGTFTKADLSMQL